VSGFCKPAYIALAIGLVPTAAAAHSPIEVGDFYSGFLHPWVHPAALLVLLAASMWISQQARDTARRGWFAVLTGGAVGAAGLPLLPPDGVAVWPAALLATIAGVLAAVACLAPPRRVAAVALGAGFVATAVHTPEALGDTQRPWLFCLGLGLGTAAGTLMLIGALVARRHPGVRLGRRIVGSWIAAVAAMLAALAIRG